MKKVLATILAAAMILSLGVTAFAAQRVDSDGSLGTSVGEQAAFTEDTNTGATTFSIVDKSATVPTYQVSVTVPLTVTFAVAKDGTTAVPSQTAYKMLNHSFDKKVTVKKIQAEQVGNTWTLVAAGSEGAEIAKKVSMKINGIDLSTTTSGLESGLDAWTMAAPTDAQRVEGVALELPMEAKAAPQNGDAETTTEAFKVTYTIALSE